ncbi:MAG: carbamoyltransferase C-terminal domain-containing protein, partial [Pseudobdellovibrio sp.]
NDSECSTMALAAFGKPTYYDEVRKIVKPHTDGTYELDLSYFNFVNPHELPLTAKFIKIFGPARSHKEKINFDCFMDAKLQKVSVEEQRYADIACSIQQVVEEELIKLAQKSQVLTGSENLCFSGGVAMNCVANSKLAASAVFKNIFVPIDPGDGGGAIGSALYTSFLKEPEKQKIPEVASPYLGTALHTEAAIKTLSGFKKDKFKITAFEDDNSLAQYCADLLFDKKIMGWAQGRAENGPRALGHRSILIRPDDIDLAKKLSQSVKKRAYFRPYACSLATEAAEVLFENTLIDSQNKLRQLKWMQTAAAVKPEAQSKIRSTIHIDGTTRPQICSIEDDRSYYQLLTAFGERSGLAALLNTSFNLSGFPLVNSSHEALLMFMSTAMDVLVLDRHVIEK